MLGVSEEVVIEQSRAFYFRMVGWLGSMPMAIMMSINEYEIVRLVVRIIINV